MTTTTGSSSRDGDGGGGGEDDGGGSDGYAPYPLVTDPRAFGLSTSVVSTSVGAVTVRHTSAPASTAPASTSAGSAGVGAPVPGSAAALVLLHGAAGSWSTFTPLLQAAAADGLPLVDLVIPDLPGWGDSALPADHARLTIEAIALSVAEVVRSLGYSRWTLIGHSLGGFVALDLAARVPEATDRVLLVSATTFSIIESVKHPFARFRLLPGYVGMLFVMRTLSLLGRSGTALVRSTASTRLFRAVMGPLFAHPERVDPSIISALANEARPRSFALASARAGAYDAPANWACIRCPVLSVHGDHDVFVADSDDAALAAVIPDFVGVVQADAGHFAHVEHPLPVLRRFFSRT